MRYMTVLGTVRRRSVALATRDPALYAELADVLRDRRIPTVSLLPGQRVPRQAAVVLTSEEEAASIVHHHVLAVPREGDRTGVWAEVGSALMAHDGRGELVVGIDPGPRPGYAVLEGNDSIAEGVLEDPEAVGRLGSHLRRRFPGRPIRFRVGSGDRLARDRIVNALLPVRRPVEVVNEQGTTPRGTRRPRDVIAARAIGRTVGRPVVAPARLRITPGEVANLQRLSREGSGGQFTIPRRVAEGVLRGELSLTEALSDGARRYGGSTAAPKAPSHRPAERS
jgi:hypothetical protein